MNPPAPLPLALRVVALLFLLTGLESLFHILAGFLHYQIVWDWGALGVFAYFGLLRLSQGWRTCALFLAGLSIVFFPITGIPSLFAVYFTFNFFGEIGPTIPSFFTFLMTCFWLVVALWQWKVLTRPDIVSLFPPRTWIS